MRRLLILVLMLSTAACSSAPLAKLQTAFNGRELVVGIVIDVTPYLARTAIAGVPELSSHQQGGDIINDGVVIQVKTDAGIVVVRCAGDYLESGSLANRCASRLTNNAKIDIKRDGSGNAVAVDVD